MRSFGLELAEDKTNLVKFSRLEWTQSGALEFLGFAFRWGRNHRRTLVLKRRTARKKYRASLARFYEWIRANCRLAKDKFFAALNGKLRGYCNHHGVRGNFDSIDDFFYHVTRMLYRLLYKPSQSAAQLYTTGTALPN